MAQAGDLREHFEKKEKEEEVGSVKEKWTKRQKTR